MIAMTLARAAALLDGDLLGEDVRFATVGSDTRSLEPGALFVALQGPHFDGHEFVAAARAKGACAALVSRSPMITDFPLLRVADTRVALGLLGAAWRQRFAGVVIGLTGSNGKTTVKEMVSRILGQRGRVLATRGNLNNDIGMPLTLLRLQDEHDFAVIEMGANHAGEIAYLSQLARPHVAILNNAGHAHLEGFGSLDGVAAAKGEIFQGLEPDGVAVINRDDPYADYWRGLVPDKRCVSFGLDSGADVRAQMRDSAENCFQLVVDGQEIDIRLPMRGGHNVRNALAAAAASLAVGVSLQAIRQGLERMESVPGRLQRFSGRHGSVVINDAYNANPASLEAALVTHGVEPGAKWLVLGDMAELGDGAEQLHAEAGRKARGAGFERLYALGRWARHAVSSFGPGGHHFETAEELIRHLDAAVAGTAHEPLILIKGSRSMRMERIVQALVAEVETPLRERTKR